MFDVGQKVTVRYVDSSTGSVKMGQTVTIVAIYDNKMDKYPYLVRYRDCVTGKDRYVCFAKYELAPFVKPDEATMMKELM